MIRNICAKESTGYMSFCEDKNYVRNTGKMLFYHINADKQRLNIVLLYSHAPDNSKLHFSSGCKWHSIGLCNSYQLYIGVFPISNCSV